MTLTHRFSFAIASLLSLALTGCGSGGAQQDRGFFTSGNREADQRAEQRIAKSEQTKGGGGSTSKPAQSPENLPLFERLGGETGINAIADDFVTRAMDDPRVNWNRTGVKRGGFSLTGSSTVQWNATPYKVQELKKHIGQFILLASGGPAKYDGRDMKSSHAGLKISNAEFDASVGDLKATLDNMKIGVKEQKELLAIVESTRPQVVEDR